MLKLPKSAAVCSEQRAALLWLSLIIALSVAFLPIKKTKIRKKTNSYAQISWLSYAHTRRWPERAILL